MALPQINNIQKRDGILPIAKTPFTYRPYLVKEEKILLTASESGDSNEIISAIRQIVSNCTFGTVNPDKISLVDLTYIMIKLRGASRGDTLDLSIKCKKCDTINSDIVADLTLAKLEGEIPDTVIKLTDMSGITVKLPDLKDIGLLVGGTGVEMLYETIANSIVSIYHGDELYDVKNDVSKEELHEFIDSLTSVQIKKIETYFEQIPKIVLNIEFSCIKCDNKEDLVVSDILSFFD